MAHLPAGTRIDHAGFGKGTVVRVVPGGWSGVDRVVVDFDSIVVTTPGNYNRHRTGVSVAGVTVTD